MADSYFLPGSTLQASTAKADASGRRYVIPQMQVVDGSGNLAGVAGKQETFTLANNVSAAGDYPATPGGSTFGQVVYGGDYVWTVLGTLGSGGSAQLKSVIRNANGGIVGTQNIGAAKTAADTNGGTGVGLGSNAEVFVTLTGAALSGVTVQISRLP